MGEDVELTVETSQHDGRTVVAVGGEVDVYTAPRLRDALTTAVAENEPRIYVDLRKVSFMDSTGLGVLVGGLKKARGRGGSLELVCDGERLLKIFEITGLAKVFTIHTSIEV